MNNPTPIRRTMTERMMTNPIFTPLLAMLLGLLPAPLVAADADDLAAIKTELEALRKGQEQTRDDVAQIRKLIEGARAQARQEAKFEPIVVDVGASPVRGDAKATLVLLEFSDYQCPFCRRHAVQVLPELLKNYVDTGKVKFVMKEFPIASLHPESARASHAALCAQDQGKYWEMHDLLFATPRDVAPETLKAYAAKLDLKASRFAACLDDEKDKDRLAADMELGGKLGVSGTPTFFLGVAEPGSPDKVRLTARIPGAVAYPVFSGAIDAMLAPADAKP
ncbi:MAG: thioredoxin domain-containing protein [Porticoccaceae bacterium]